MEYMVEANISRRSLNASRFLSLLDENAEDFDLQPKVLKDRNRKEFSSSTPVPLKLTRKKNKSPLLSPIASPPRPRQKVMELSLRARAEARAAASAAKPTSSVNDRPPARETTVSPKRSAQRALDNVKEADADGIANQEQPARKTMSKPSTSALPSRSVVVKSKIPDKTSQKSTLKTKASKNDGDPRVTDKVKDKEPPKTKRSKADNRTETQRNLNSQIPKRTSARVSAKSVEPNYADDLEIEEDNNPSPRKKAKPSTARSSQRGVEERNYQEDLEDQNEDGPSLAKKVTSKKSASDKGENSARPAMKNIRKDNSVGGGGAKRISVVAEPGSSGYVSNLILDSGSEKSVSQKRKLYSGANTLLLPPENGEVENVVVADEPLVLPGKTGKSRRKSNVPKKLNKAKPGSGVLKEIRQLQRSTDLLMKKAPFSRVVREICQKMERPNLFWAGTALMALQEGAEAYLITVFEQSYLVAQHAKRVTLMPNDMRLISRIRGSV